LNISHSIIIEPTSEGGIHAGFDCKKDCQHIIQNNNQPGSTGVDLPTQATVQTELFFSHLSFTIFLASCNFYSGSTESSDGDTLSSTSTLKREPS
jgi:hypothetical protein